MLENLKEKPHQTRHNFFYISIFVRTNQDVVDALGELVADETVSDYQRIFLLAALLRVRTTQKTS